MFYFLRRVIIAAWLAATFAVGWAAETRFGLYDRGVAFGRYGWGQLQILKNWRADQRKISDVFEAELMKLLPDGLVQVRNQAGYLYNVKLEGIQIPTENAPADGDGGLSLKKQCERALERLVAADRVQVWTTEMSPLRAGFGFVFVDERNVSVELARLGLAQFDQRRGHAAPTAVRLALEKAQDEAKRNRSGIWSDE